MSAAAPDFGHMTNLPLHIAGVEYNEYAALYETESVALEAQPSYPRGQISDVVDTQPAYPTPNVEMEEDTEAGELFSCNICKKQFLRPCDLNKHVKTHSRPYKCPEPACEYHEVGWPTEKEADRHYNDKHAVAPQTFRCFYCTHTSKRRSNLDQHMEKAHGRPYVRSRSMKLYRCPVAGCSNCATVEESQERHGGIGQLTPISAASQHNVGDFVLFPDGVTPTTPVISGSGGGLYVQMSNDSYVPWDSPPTRGENISNCLRSVDSVINSSLVDPRLAQPPYGNMPQYVPLRQPVHDPAFKSSSSPPAFTMSNLGWGEGMYSAMSKDGQSPSKAPAGRGRNVAYSPSLSGPQNFAAGDVRRFKEDDGDDSDGDGDDDDDEPPRKRPRTGSDAEFDDDQMPCPFRRLDPEYFDRNNKEKFSPCHTKHKDISTIVRHLSRPAHHLDVTERSVSSFDTAEDENPTLKGALCRRCWKIFRVESEFEDHLRQPCVKVSRGKREKFDLLFRTFCSDPFPVETRPHRLSSVQAGKLPQPIVNEAAEMPEAYVSERLQPEHPLHDEDEDAPVSRREHRALQEKYKGLKKSVQEILKYLNHGKEPKGSTSLADDLSRQTEMEMETDEDARDRESLVSGMNSRPTDVLRDRFLFEAQRTLSGLSSCSDKSSVHHVPSSPHYEATHERMAHAASAVATPSKPAQRYADSGYGGSSTKDKTRVKQSVSSTELETVQEQRGAGSSFPGDSQVNHPDYFQEVPEAGVTNIDDLWPGP